MIKRESGYTAVELLIAVSIAMLVIGFVYSSYHFSLRMMKTWREKIQCEDAALICMDKINRDIVVAVDIRNIAENETALIEDNGGTIVYRVRDACLYRNGFQMNPPSVIVDTVVIRYMNAFEIAEFTEPAIEYSRPPADFTMAGIIPVTVEFVLHNKSKHIALRSAVLSRNSYKRSFQNLQRSIPN